MTRAISELGNPAFMVVFYGTLEKDEPQNTVIYRLNLGGNAQFDLIKYF